MNLLPENEENGRRNGFQGEDGEGGGEDGEGGGNGGKEVGGG